MLERVAVCALVRAVMLLGVSAVSPSVLAQAYDYSYVCEDMRNSFIVDGGINLTAADLLSCGMSPEAIGAQLSINGPYGVGRENECSYLPLG